MAPTIKYRAVAQEEILVSQKVYEDSCDDPGLYQELIIIQPAADVADCISCRDSNSLTVNVRLFDIHLSMILMLCYY